ncbi:ribonuclease H-like domain-containing protein [Tanacetum coccineum]|uniref:Ribonuclease H-like domain-containing protein n=1 Tax=Tanacetum coccineum TaxID=301880 RepID=A0ABQ5F164_9ASTR
MCDKKNKVLFTDTECLVLSLEFKLPDENQVLLRIPRQNNMYSFNLENIVPTREFKNRDMIDFCGSKGIKREYSNVRTPHQNGVAKRKNRTLIKAARTMLADLFLPNTFWAEAVSTACYVLNRVLVTKPHNKTSYELITSKIPIISYIRPFGCHVTILNTIDHLGTFEEKAAEGFLVGYSLNSKDFRVYNLETKRVEENLHINLLKNKPNVAGKGPTWLFDLDYLTDSMNYQAVTGENKANKTASPIEANGDACTQDNYDAGNSEKEAEPVEEHFVLPFWPSYSSTFKSSETKNKDAKPNEDTGLKSNEEPVDHAHQICRNKRSTSKDADEKPVDKEDQVFLDELERLKRQEQDANNAAEALRKEFAQETKDLLLQAGAAKTSSTNIVNNVSTPVSTASPYGGLTFTDLTNPDQDDSEIPALEEIYDNPTDGIFTNSSYDDEGAVADFTNLEPIVNVSPIPTSRINSIHPLTLILGDPQLAVQTRNKVTKSSGAHAFVSYIQKQRRNNHKDFEHCLFACFLSQNEPKKISEICLMGRRLLEQNGFTGRTAAIQDSKSVYDLCLSLYTQSLDEECILEAKIGMKESLKSNWMQKESVSKQGRKSAKAEPSVHKDPLFDELPKDTLDYMETEDAQDVGRTREVVNEEKETVDDEVSTEDVLSTAQQKVSTDKEKVSIDRPNVSTDRPKVSTDKEKDSTVRTDKGTVDQTKGRRATPTTPTTTPTMFGDDETIAQVLLNMSQANQIHEEKDKEVLKLNELLALRLQDEEREQFTLCIEKVKRFDESFTAVGSTEDERRIKEMNEGVKDTNQKRLKEEDTSKVPAKVEVTEQGTIDSEIIEKKSFIARLNKIMMESSTEGNDQSDFWDDQQDWKIVTWRLYEACGVCILEFEDGTIIHMLVERRYPLYKDLLQRMLDLGLEVERESIVALDLIRFIKQQIDEE